MARTLTLANVQSFDDTARENMLAFARNAVSLHHDAIMEEIAYFDAMRHNHETLWIQRTLMKSILSSGAFLDKDIAFAKLLVRALRDGENIRTYDDAEPYRAACKYGARSVGQNINRALFSWNTICTLGADDMTLDRLIALKNGKMLQGLSHKTIRWALALFNARTRVFTCDTHMIERAAIAAGLGDGYGAVAPNAYVALERWYLSIADELGFADMPLLVQWAIWNEHRHAGQHANHLEIALD